MSGSESAMSAAASRREKASNAFRTMSEFSAMASPGAHAPGRPPVTGSSGGLALRRALHRLVRRVARPGHAGRSAVRLHDRAAAQLGEQRREEQQAERDDDDRHQPD